MANQRQRESVADYPQEQPIPEEAVRTRAHEIYEERGSQSGHDVDDWLEAERELRSEHEQRS